MSLPGRVVFIGLMIRAAGTVIARTGIHFAGKRSNERRTEKPKRDCRASGLRR
jgi:hypothetical protein